MRLLLLLLLLLLMLLLLLLLQLPREHGERLLLLLLLLLVLQQRLLQCKQSHLLLLGRRNALHRRCGRGKLGLRCSSRTGGCEVRQRIGDKLRRRNVGHWRAL